MWLFYEVSMNFEGRLCGSVPLSKELIRPWLESRMPNAKPEDARPIEEIEEEVLASIEEAEERTTLGFQQDINGLFVRAGTIKAHIKDCANQIKDVVKVKALRSKVANKVFIEPDPIHIQQANGEFVQSEDGEFERAVHVMTAQGPRNALKRIRYIEQPTITFTVRLLKDKEVTPDVLRSIFEYGSVHGYGGERGMGEGRYAFSMEGIAFTEEIGHGNTKAN